MITVVILLGVAAAIIFAALYAFFGTPRSRTGKKRKQEVTNGFRLAGGILLGFVLVTALVGAAGVAFFGAESSRVSRPLAVVIAVAAFGCIAVMVQRWAKYSAGWIGYGVLNGLAMIFSGHLVNNPAVRVSRQVAVTMTALTLVSALMCLRFTEKYQLNWVDKVALLGWILAFTVAANAEKYGLTAFGVSCAGLVAAYLYSRSKRHARRKHRRELVVP